MVDRIYRLFLGFELTDFLKSCILLLQLNELSLFLLSLQKFVLSFFPLNALILYFESIDSELVNALVVGSDHRLLGFDQKLLLPNHLPELIRPAHFFLGNFLTLTL